MDAGKITEFEGIPVYFDKYFKNRVMAVNGPVDFKAAYQGCCVLNHKTNKVTMLDGSPIVHPNPEMIGKTEIKAYIVGTKDISEAIKYIKKNIKHKLTYKNKK